ncbi:hypothetical protein GMSM_46360 [Geomonas sp. Red276]
MSLKSASVVVTDQEWAHRVGTPTWTLHDQIFQFPPLKTQPRFRSPRQIGKVVLNLIADNHLSKLWHQMRDLRIEC